MCVKVKYTENVLEVHDIEYSTFKSNSHISKDIVSFATKYSIRYGIVDRDSYSRK